MSPPSVPSTWRQFYNQWRKPGGGIGGEIAAQLAEHALLDLKAPVLRVAGYDTVMPYAKKEALYLPGTAEISSAIQQVLNFA